MLVVGGVWLWWESFCLLFHPERAPASASFYCSSSFFSNNIHFDLLGFKTVWINGDYSNLILLNHFQRSWEDRSCFQLISIVPIPNMHQASLPPLKTPWLEFGPKSYRWNASSMERSTEGYLTQAVWPQFVPFSSTLIYKIQVVNLPNSPVFWVVGPPFFFHFHPDPWGFMIQFDWWLILIFFKMGWGKTTN